jgi:hypothetical protein
MWKPLIRLRKRFILRPKFYLHRRVLICGMNGPSKKEFYKRYEKAQKVLLDAERRGERYDIAHAEGVLEIMRELMNYGQTNK